MRKQNYSPPSVWPSSPSELSSGALPKPALSTRPRTPKSQSAGGPRIKWFQISDIVHGRKTTNSIKLWFHKPCLDSFPSLVSMVGSQLGPRDVEVPFQVGHCKAAVLPWVIIANLFQARQKNRWPDAVVNQTPVRFWNLPSFCCLHLVVFLNASKQELPHGSWRSWNFLDLHNFLEQQRQVERSRPLLLSSAMRQACLWWCFWNVAQKLMFPSCWLRYLNWS